MSKPGEKKNSGGQGSQKASKGSSTNKKEDGSFDSRKIKHDPQAESSRAVFGQHGESE